MSIVWTLGGIIFYLRRERKAALPLIEQPMVSILVPCFNEQATIVETVSSLHDLNYDHYEVIVINDGSSDRTAELLQWLLTKHPRLRVINLRTNRGKASALYLGTIASRGEIIVTLDADSVLDGEALRYLVPHFITPNNGERVGAVTGNPRVRNRARLMARVQVCEFSSIIGLIKRAQRIMGKVMTVSGVIVAFRKRALLDCGLWDRDIITDDISVTWNLQKRHWDIRYEPRALCWMRVPESFAGFWRQRQRWAQGGLEVLSKHWKGLFCWRQRRLVPIYMEQVLSVVWSFSWAVSVLAFGRDWLTGRGVNQSLVWSGSYLACVCLVQFLIGMLLDRRYDPGIMKYYLWSIWYPVIYWYLSAIAVLYSIPALVFRSALGSPTGNATWVSPDRGEESIYANE